MKVLISFSAPDRRHANRIANAVKSWGHEALLDAANIAPDVNAARKVANDAEGVDAIVPIISKYLLSSNKSQKEVTSLALKSLSNPKIRIIPVKIDDSVAPSYLGNRVYIDLSENVEAGLEALRVSLLPRADGDTVPPRPDTRPQHIDNLTEALRFGRLTLVCGAGASIEAGIPVWGDLLGKLLETMMEKLSQSYSINAGRKAVAEFQKRHHESALILGKYLKNNLGRDFASYTRDALYAANPETSPLIKSIVSLARPQRDGKPLDSIITFNFDSLVEENLLQNSIPNRAISSEAVKHSPSELPIYHVHGYLPRKGKIPSDSELVFSEDAYHSQFIDPFSWSNLIQLNKLTHNTCLFVGISLTDPNMRRLLDVAWRKNSAKALSHYIVKKAPRGSEDSVIDELTKLLEEQDANALGLNVIWIDDFSELPKILEKISAGRP
ncbi:SIR2 family protein [Agrobacterium tumefaciens]|uniref:SIR2 family protein n=1 Tax=Agrobacterium tumefaciens TaxID=358 RepID=UPI001CBFEAA5|nr:SIR2 family protein [Agrobacterium tumefaciens]